MSGNAIGDGGAEAISDALKENTSLINIGNCVHPDLSGNNLCDASAQAISGMLKVNHALKILSKPLYRATL